MKRSISVILTVVMLFSMLVAVIPMSASAATAATNTGLTFGKGYENLYSTNKKLTVLPKTFEATITLPPASSSNIYEGDVLAFFDKDSSTRIMIDMVRKNENDGDASGNLGLRLLCNDGQANNEVYKVYYNVFNGRAGETLHIAITVDTAVKLYIDGEIYEGGSYCKRYSPYENINEATFLSVYNNINVQNLPYLTIGGDNRKAVLGQEYENIVGFDNYRYFRGAIFNACIFSDIRSANEVAADKTTLPTSDANLLMSYDTSDLSDGIIPDKSGNGYTIKKGVFYGKSFASGLENVYATKKQVTALPKTFEATITVPNVAANKKMTFEGDIFAFYNQGTNTQILVDTLRRNSNNNADDMNNLGIRILCNNGTSLATKVYYDAFNDYIGQTIHVAITIDTAVNLYINGELIASDGNCYYTNSCTDDASFLTVYNGINLSELPCLSIGGDNRTAVTGTDWDHITGFDNYRYFRGNVFNACIFSDARNANEVAADKNTLLTSDANLLMSYDFSEETASRVVADKTGNGYDISAYIKWLDADKKVPVTDYAYSFAVVGDTQVITRDEAAPWQTSTTANPYYSEDYAGSFAKIYDWILNNQDSKNIQFSFHMGDITDWNQEAEWKLAMENITRMNGKIPHNIIRGNHDQAPTMVSKYTTDIFEDAVVVGEEFGYFDGRGIEGYNVNTLNTYQTITVGDVMYLMLALDFGPCEAVIDWANDVIEAHPYHNVIISTHSYLQGDYTGTWSGMEHYPYMDGNKYCAASSYNPGGSEGVYDFRLDQHKNGGEAYRYQDASYMLHNLVKKHENISMVLCGHECSEYVKQISTTGDAGNTVLQFLVDGQGVDADLRAENSHAGLVAMFYFSEDGKKVTTEYYSTIRDQYLHDGKNTNTYTVNTVSVPTEVKQFYALMHSLDSNDYSDIAWIHISNQLAQTKNIVLTSDSATERSAAVAALQTVVENAIDRSELVDAIEDAEALVETDYSESDWTDIQNAIAAAEEKLNAATQDEIDTAAETLNSVVSEKTKINRSGLTSAIINAAGLDESDYTADSWATFEEALKDAQTKLTSRTQSEIDAATTTLNEAIEGLQRNTSTGGNSGDNTGSDDGENAGGNTGSGDGENTGSNTDGEASTDAPNDSSETVSDGDSSNENEDDESDGGCGSVITASTIVLTTVLALGVGFKKKEN